VAPTVNKSAAPMKTIKLRRPTDIPPAPGAVKLGGAKPTLSPLKPEPPAAPAPAAPEAAAAPAPAPAPADSAETAAAPAESAETLITQKKTLKLTRPGGGLKRPTLGTPAIGASDGVADLSGDVPELKPLDVADFGAAVPEVESSGVPGWLMAITTIASLAALLVLGAVFYFLFTEGCAPVAGENYTAFISL
jgi:hypothetical protein